MATQAPPATGLRSSRPDISLGGQTNAALGQGLLALRIEESVDGIYHCELTIGNWGPAGDKMDFLYFDRRDVDFGKSLTISLAGATLFSGRIIGLEGQFGEGTPPQIALLADDRLQDLRMTRRTRTFEQVSDKQVAEQIAADNGLTPDVQLDGPTHRVLAQVNQSDLGFIRDRCRAVDGEVWVDDRTLTVRKRSSRAAQPFELGYGHELREVSVTADLAGQQIQVTVGGWDVAAKEAISEVATSSAIESELKGGDGSSSILARTIGSAKQIVAHTAPATGAEAKARAEALYRQRARRFVRAHGIADTTGGLRVGRSVKLTGIGPLFSGEYYVTDVCHRFEPVNGLRTEFAAERPGLGRP